jgi:hypothetical protein
MVMSKTQAKKAARTKKQSSTRARLYVVTGKKPDVELNGAIMVILTHARKHSKGISERQIMADLKMPRSTVWYALVKLVKLHAVTTLKTWKKAA